MIHETFTTGGSGLLCIHDEEFLEILQKADDLFMYLKRCVEHKKREMVLSWQLLIALFALTANSLQDLNLDSRKNNKAAREWTLDNGDSNTAGPSEIAQPSGEEDDVMRSDISISNGRGGCNSYNNEVFGRIRARDGKSCVNNFLQFSRTEENGRQLLPVKPNAQQGVGGQNSGGSGDPEFPVLLPGENDLLQFLFIPRENRPTRDPRTCPEPWRPFPICGRPGDTYRWTNGVAPGLVVDPAYLCTFSRPP